MTDELLLGEVRRGNDAAFRSLYERYRDPLFRCAWRLTGSAEASEDIVHDCFTSLLRGGFDPSRACLKTYVYAAVRNLSRKFHRDNGREDLSDDFDQIPVTAGDPLVALVARETAEEVRVAVESLPFLQREVLILFEYEELQLDQIATIVQADLSAVKSRLHRARERLRRALLSARKGAAK